MKILVANLGSTSFKYRLFDIETETQLARGGIDRIGQIGAESSCTVEIGEHQASLKKIVPDHAVAVQICLEQLTDPKTGCLQSVSEVAAIGFKAVFAGNLSGVRLVTEELLTKMESLAAVAPAHNPPYARAMRELQAAFPEMPLVAALETGFHETIPDANRVYAVPYEWREKYSIQRWGFHGASHRFIGQRVGELMERTDLKIVSCHLGGSNSLCAQKEGTSQATTMGMSPQTGLPQNNRVGDFDPFALPILMQSTGKTLDELLVDLGNQSGLLGLSGVSGDIRDLEQAASEGNERAQLALDTFVTSIRQYIGAYMAVLGGIDAIVFTGGIGENSRYVREKVCADFGFVGLELDAQKNLETGATERNLATDASKIAVWVIPTNEELVVARQTATVLN